MLDINMLRKTPDVVRENMKKKFQDAKLYLVDEVIELDIKNREAMQQADNLRNQRKVLSKQIGGLMKQGKKDEAEATKAQVAAIADGIEQEVYEKLGQKLWRIEGQQNAFWIAMDYVDVVVHIFQTELREFYRLEELWADAPIKKYEYEL